MLAEPQACWTILNIISMHLLGRYITLTQASLKAEVNPHARYSRDAKNSTMSTSGQ